MVNYNKEPEGSLSYLAKQDGVNIDKYLDELGMLNPPTDTQVRTLWLVSQYKSLLIANSVGTGKTYIGIAAAKLNAITQNLPLKCLVICPQHLTKDAWEMNIHKHTENECVVIEGTPKQRMNMYNTAIQNAEYVICSDTTFLKDVSKLPTEWISQFTTLLFDDMGALKNFESVKYNVVIKYLLNIPNRYIITGSPQHGVAYGMLSLYRILDPSVFGVDLWKVRNQWFNAIEKDLYTDWRLKEKLTKEYIQKVWTRKIVFTEKTLPPFEEIECPIPANEDIIQKLRIVADRANMVEVTRNYAPNVFALKSKVISGITAQYSPKFDKLCEIVEKHLDEQIIIWAYYTDEIKFITDKLIEKFGANVKAIHQDTKHNRENDFKKWRSGDIDIFVANPKSIASGLDLCESRICIYWSVIGSDDDMIQTRGRVRRMIQKKKCLFYNLFVEDTIDAGLYYHTKRKLIKAIKRTYV